MLKICLLLSLVLLQSPSQPSPLYSQSYRIIIKGAIAGTEVVNERLDSHGNVVADSEHEIILSDGLETKRMAFSTSMVAAKGSMAPVQYRFQYTSGESRDSYEVNVKNGELTRVLTRAGRSSEIRLPAKPGMMILDFSVYHQYDWLIRKYDLRKGGRQAFSAFIPLIGADIPLTLTLLPDSRLKYGNKTVEVRNFRADFMDLWTGTLSMDKQNRLVRLVIPGQDLEIVRQDLVDETKN